LAESVARWKKAERWPRKNPAGDALDRFVKRGRDVGSGAFSPESGASLNGPASRDDLSKLRDQGIEECPGAFAHLDWAMASEGITLFRNPALMIVGVTESRSIDSTWDSLRNASPPGPNARAVRARNPFGGIVSSIWRAVRSTARNRIGLAAPGTSRVSRCRSQVHDGVVQAGHRAVPRPCRHDTL